MKNYILLGTLSLVASTMLVGCGSSNITESDLETGYFIDAPVQGLTYKTTSGTEGITDTYGRFQYKHGEKVRFMIGKLDLGEALPDQEGLITPESIAQNDQELKIYLLRVLQALDSDNNPSNGITIPENVISALSGLTEDITIVKVKNDKDLLNLHSTLAEVLDEDYDGTIDVDNTTAQTHFEHSISQWQQGHKPDENRGQNNNSTQGHGNAQSQQNEQSGNHKGNMGSALFDLSQYPMSTLTQDVKDALAYMGNEERLAYDVYMNLYDYHAKNGNTIRQFQNIATRSESKHIEIVKDLVKKYNLGAADLTNVENPIADKDVTFEDMPSGQYDVPSIQVLYDTLYAKGVTSVQDALEVGCMVEVTDVDDLDIWIAKAEEANATDVIEGFKILRNGSYNHYWAFDKGLKNMGISEGCAVLGSEYAKTKEEYPSSH